MSSTRWRSGFSSLFVVVLAAFIALGAIYYRQNIVDTVHAWQYQPSAQMIMVRDKLDFTTKGETLFNASQPEIEDAAVFNKSCQQQKETNNPILGCYVGQEIFIFGVTNPKLKGIEETTAAHELLHAVYERLSAAERKSLDKDIQLAYEKVKTPALEERMRYYKESEPGQELNELHSILGTEFADVGEGLESHYAQYFKDRSKVLGYFNDYNSVFTSASSRLKKLQSEINSQTEIINGEISAYNKAVGQLKKDVEAFNQRANNGGFVTQAQFSSARGDIVARQSALDDDRTKIIASIEQVNAKRITFNELAKEYNALNQSINSSLAPLPSFN